jgi:hypothetical protein
MSRAIFPESFLQRITGFQQATKDLSPIMPKLEELVYLDNEEGLLRGTDKDGRPLTPLSPVTLKNPRRGSGGPLIPQGRSSRFIADYRVSSIRRGDGIWMLLGSWEGIPFAQYHFEGTNRLPRRDLRGIRPKGREKIMAALRNWLLSRLRRAT